MDDRTGKVTITISSDGSAASAAGVDGTGGNDTNAFTVSYVGGSNDHQPGVQSGRHAAHGGQRQRRQQWGDVQRARSHAIGGTATYFENSLPGSGVPARAPRRSR